MTTDQLKGHIEDYQRQAQACRIIAGALYSLDLPCGEVEQRAKDLEARAQDTQNYLR